MPYEHVLPVKFFLTALIFTMKIFLFQVSFLVVLACAISFEFFGAELAGERSLPSVSPIMIIRVCFVVEYFWAESTRVYSSFFLSSLFGRGDLLIKLFDRAFFL